MYLGARHMPTHQEVFPEDLPIPGLPLPERFDFASEADCLAMAAKLPFSQVSGGCPAFGRRTCGFCSAFSMLAACSVTFQETPHRIRGQSTGCRRREYSQEPPSGRSLSDD